MEKKKVLFISQEITPYLPETELSKIGRNLPQGIQENGKEIRTFMPRFGCINERRNQLHEVIRLSGMNLVVNDADHPLIIKVASIQAARMQVYFIDNEDYFQRKATLVDKEGKEFEDNDERAIFFARGVLETVIKLRWAPDVIHCQGWFTGLVAVFLKHMYKDNPLFADTKIVYSSFSSEFETPLDKELKKKLMEDEIPADVLSHIDEPTYVNFNKLIVDHVDGIIKGSENINEDLEKYIEASGKPFLGFQDEEKYVEAFNSFYDNFLLNSAE